MIFISYHHFLIKIFGSLLFFVYLCYVMRKESYSTIHISHKKHIMIANCGTDIDGIRGVLRFSLRLHIGFH